MRKIQHSAIFKLQAKPVIYHHVRCDEELRGCG